MISQIKLSNLSTLLLFLLAMCTATVADDIPDMEGIERLEVSHKTEKVLGDIMVQELNAYNVLLHDPLLNQYLNHLGQQLVRHANKREQRFNFFPVQDHRINAFAFFGGNVAIHTGLITASSNESQLAGVMAHEISHITQHHILRMISKHKRLMPLTVAEFLGAVAIGVFANPEAGSHLAMAALAGHQQMMLNYSRDHEHEADRIGIQVLAKAGFDPNGMPEFFKTLSKNHRYDSRPPEYLMTHPVTESRIAESLSRANQLETTPHADSLSYSLMKQRALVLQTSNQKRLISQYQHQQPNNKQAKIAKSYGLAFALAKQRQFDEAIKTLKPIAESYPENMELQVTLAEIYLLANQSKASQAILKTQYAIYPTAKPVILLLAEAYLLDNKATQARLLLESKQNLFVDHSQWVELTAKAQGLSGDKAKLHETRSEWYRLRGDFKGAQQQLDLAIEFGHNSKQNLARIKKRKQRLQEIERQQRKVNI